MSAIHSTALGSEDANFGRSLLQLASWQGSPGRYEETVKKDILEQSYTSPKKQSQIRLWIDLLAMQGVAAKYRKASSIGGCNYEVSKKDALPPGITAISLISASLPP